MKMATLLIVLAGLVLASAYILIWMNRASVIIVQAALPAAITLLSALILVFLANRAAPISRVFPVVFVIEKASRLPVVIPNRPFRFQVSVWLTC